MQTQDDLLNLMNQFIADLAVINIKLHNYHWNIVGPFFDEIHNKTADYYQQILSWYDQVGECIKMYGAYPLTSLKSYSLISKIKDSESKDYYDTDVLKSIVEDFNYLLNTSNKIEQLATKSGDTRTTILFGEIITYIEKQLWMLKASLK